MGNANGVGTEEARHSGDGGQWYWPLGVLVCLLPKTNVKPSGQDSMWQGDIID